MPEGRTFGGKGVKANPDQNVHWVTLYSAVGVTGMLVGHVKEIPGVVVQADTRENLEAECSKSLDLLILQYPEIHDQLWPTHMTAKGLSDHFKNGMQIRTIEVAAPQF